MGLPYCDVRKFSIIDGLAANTVSDIAPDTRPPDVVQYLERNLLL